MARNARERLISAADTLFTTEGIEGVSQRRILVEAGQRNQSAIQYHFGSRQGLIRAVLERRVMRVNERRVRMIDAIRDRGLPPTLEQVVEAMVRPFTAQLLDGPDGRQYFRMFAEIMHDPSLSLSEIVRDKNEGLMTLLGWLEGLLPGMPPAVLKTRLYAMTWMLVGTLSEWDRDNLRADRVEQLTIDLQSMIVAMLQAPVQARQVAGRAA